MCLYDSSKSEPTKPNECLMNNRGEMMIPVKDIVAMERGCTVRITPISPANSNSDVTFTFNILLTTQLSETILNSGVWSMHIGKFVHKKYTGYFNTSAESVSLFIQSKFKRVSGDVWLIPLEEFKINRLPAKIGAYNGQQSVFTFSKNEITEKCDPSKYSVVCLYLIKCVLFFGANTDQSLNEQVNIMFVDDKGSILLEDGIGFSLPSPFGTTYNFTYLPSGKDVSTLSLSSPAYQLSILAKEISAKESPASFQAAGRNNFALHIPTNKLSSEGHPVLDISLKNIEHEIDIAFNSPGQDRAAFDLKNYIQIQASSGVENLIPEVRSSHSLLAGVCKYFTFTKMAKSYGVLSVTADLSGEISVYVKKTAVEFAEAKNFDVKAKSDLSVIIPLNSTVEGQGQKIEDYSVSVCSRDPVPFNILLNLDLVIPFTNIPAGDILKREIKSGESFAVQYTASKGEKFIVNVDSETTIVSVYHSEYSSNLQIDSVVNMIPEAIDSNLLLKTSGLGIPGSSTIVAPNDQLVTNYIFRITPKSTDLVTFYIGSSKPSAQILLRQNEKLQEKLAIGEKRTYLLRTTDLERELKALVNVAYGRVIVYTLTDKDTSNDVKADIVGGNQANSKVLSITPKKKSNNENPLESVMHEANVTIEAKSETMYDITFLQPTESFTRIAPGKQYLLDRRHNKNAMKYFYQIRDTQDISSFKVFFFLDLGKGQSITNFKDFLLLRTRFYYITEDKFSIDDNDSLGKIVADIKETKESNYGKRKVISFEFAVQKGYFMVAFSEPQELFQYTLTLELSMNNYFTLGANTYMVDYSLPTESQGYQIYVPQAGKLWIDFEDCSNQLVAFGSQDFYKTRPHSKDRTKLVTESIKFTEPGFYYVLVMHKQGPTGPMSTDNIPFILRTEFMDDVRSSWLKSYFSSMGNRGILDPNKVNISVAREGLKARISGQLQPSSSLIQDYNEIESMAVIAIAVATKVDDRSKRPKLPCSDLDQQLINYAKAADIQDNSTSFAMTGREIGRSEERVFDWTDLKEGLEIDVEYPRAFIDTPDRDMMVSVILLYRLFGNKQYDRFDDASVVLAIMKPVNAPEIINVPEYRTEKQEEPSEEGRAARKDSVTKIIMYLILSLVLILGGAWILKMYRRYLGTREAEGFEQASRVTTSELSAETESKQIEIAQTKNPNEPREETDQSI